MAATFAAVELGLLFIEGQKAIAALPVIAERQVREQGEKTRVFAKEIIEKEMADTRLMLSAELEGTRDFASQEIALARNDIKGIADLADSRLAGIQRDLNTQLASAGANLNDRAVDLNRTLELTSAPYRSIGQQFSDAAPLFLDCDHNADCLFNRWVGMGRGVEDISLSLGSIAKTAERSAPAFVGSVTGIADNTKRFTDKFVQPKPLYKYLIDAAPGAMAIWKIFD